MISIIGLDKAEVLAALYNASHPQGMGFLHAEPQDMTIEEARQILDKEKGQDYYTNNGYIHFEYLKGRVMKIDMTDDEVKDEYFYDRDNGAGAAQRVIDALRMRDKAAL